MLFSRWEVRIVTKKKKETVTEVLKAVGQEHHFQALGHRFSLYGPTLRR